MSNPPEFFEQVEPLHLAQSGLTIIADARLTNRQELFEKLNVPPSLQACSTDARLIAAAYEKWGENCPEHLLGNFAFAIWDEKSRQLFCCRDHIGVRPLYYYLDDKRFIFASAPKAILAAGGVEKNLNYQQLSALIVREARHLFGEQSWYEKIFSLPSGASLTVSAEGVRKRQYWEPDLERTLSYKTAEETFEALRALLFEVVESNVESAFPIVAQLSGGLDSSAMVAIAAQVLAKQNKQLEALAVVLPKEKDLLLQDERYFIDQLKSFSNVNINYITAEGKGPFDNLQELISDYNLPSITSRHYLYTAFAKTADSLGARTILDGTGGEFGLTSYGDGYYAELFAKFRWRTLWREISLRKKLVGESLRHNFRVNVLNPFVPAFIRERRKGLLIVETHPLRASLADSLAKEIRPQLAALENLANLVLPNQRSNQYRHQKIFQKQTKGRLALFGVGNAEMYYPWRDKRILEFCLAAPPALKVRDGYKRFLVRASLDKILPPEIQWRNTKQVFSPDYMRRYKAQLGRVQEFLAEITAADPINEIVDVEKLAAWAKMIPVDNERHTSLESIALHWLPQGVYLIYFLRQFSEFQK